MTKKAYGALLMNELFLMEDYGFYLPSGPFKEARPSGDDFLQDEVDFLQVINAAEKCGLQVWRIHLNQMDDDGEVCPMQHFAHSPKNCVKNGVLTVPVNLESKMKIRMSAQLSILMHSNVS